MGEGKFRFRSYTGVRAVGTATFKKCILPVRVVSLTDIAVVFQHITAFRLGMKSFTVLTKCE